MEDRALPMQIQALLSGMKNDPVLKPLLGYPMADAMGPSAIWVQKQLDRITYKPGWAFTLSPPWCGGQVLSITLDAEDTYNPGHTVKVGKSIPLYQLGYMLGTTHDEDMFMRWLAHEIQECEIHESREWFKRDGEIFDNPHK